MILELILAIENEEQRSAVLYIYNTLKDAIYQTAYNILRHPQDAEDAMMNTFLKISKNAHKFVLEDRNEMIALVSVYTRNTAKSFYRDRKRRSTVSLTVYVDEDSFETTQMDIPDDSENVERIAINKETLKMIYAALEQIPSELSDVVILKYFYGYRYPEICEVLDITENAARARMFRAKERLKKILGDEMYERLEF